MEYLIDNIIKHFTTINFVIFQYGIIFAKFLSRHTMEKKLFQKIKWIFYLTMKILFLGNIWYRLTEIIVTVWTAFPNTWNDINSL